MVISAIYHRGFRVHSCFSSFHRVNHGVKFKKKINVLEDRHAKQICKRYDRTNPETERSTRKGNSRQVMSIYDSKAV